MNNLYAPPDNAVGVLTRALRNYSCASLFGLGDRLSRLSGHFIRMANAIKPMFLFAHPDSKRNKTNVLLRIRKTNAIKPISFLLSGWQAQ